MNESVLIGLNQVAEIFARAPLSAEAADLYRRATGIADDEQFLKRLATLVKGSKSPCCLASPSRSLAERR
jgi:hypothetical protein